MNNVYHVDKMFYYHLRNKEGRPLITVCVVRKGDDFARGVSVCSLLDMPVKKVGRRIARDRALKALFNKEDDLSAITLNAFSVLGQIEDDYSFIEDDEYKSKYLPKLTAFEKELFGRNE